MTNEELVSMIKKGGSEQLLPLWEKNKGLCALKARQVLKAMEDAGRQGMELEDFMQVGFLALVDAVEQFDPNAGFRFSTVFTTRLKSHFAKSTGYQTQRQKKDPIHKAGSLDCPLDPTNPEGTTLGEVIPSTVDPIQAVEERMYQEWRSERMTHELEKLPPEQGEIIRLRYYKELSAAEIGEVTDATALEVRKRERAALDTLRRSKEIQFMHRLESNTNYFFHVGAHSGLSPVEEIVQRRETLLERWNAEGTPNNYD